MKICIIAEGSYPYITGGKFLADSDVNDRIPILNFYLYYITKKDSKGEYSYKLPENVVGIHEVFLDELSNADGKW